MGLWGGCEGATHRDSGYGFHGQEGGGGTAQCTPGALIGQTEASCQVLGLSGPPSFHRWFPCTPQATVKPCFSSPAPSLPLLPPVLLGTGLCLNPQGCALSRTMWAQPPLPPTPGLQGECPALLYQLWGLTTVTILAHGPAPHSTSSRASG